MEEDPDFNLDALDDLECDGLDDEDSGEAAAGAGHSERSTSGGGLAGAGGDSGGRWTPQPLLPRWVLRKS